MRDDRDMSVSSFEDVDPVFADVVVEMFGEAVDPRELWDVISKQNDASEMHVNRPLTKKKEEIPNWQKKVALATNAAGVIAGPAAIAMAVKAAKNKEGGIPREGLRLASKIKKFPRVARAAERSTNFLATNKKAVVAAGATGVALQTANMAGDAISTRAFMPKRKEQDIHIKKALDDILDARRRGVITTDRAIDMADRIISKVEESDAKAIHRQAEMLIDSPLLPKKTQYALKAANTTATTAGKAKPKMQQAAGKMKNKTPALPNLTWQGNIQKMDSDQRQVFGFCTVTHVDGEPVVDRQGDYVPLEEIEKAAYTYVVESRKGGDMHARDGEMPLHTSDMIESVIITPEKLEQWGLDKDAMPYGWWVGFKVNDEEQWQKVKTGERQAFSIHGSGKRVEKML